VIKINDEWSYERTGESHWVLRKFIKTRPDGRVDYKVTYFCSIEGLIDKILCDILIEDHDDIGFLEKIVSTKRELIAMLRQEDPPASHVCRPLSGT
jgi:hypothetical protein